jgi:WD40 repeat protein
VPASVRIRVVEVEADLGQGRTPRWRYGSGLLIGGRTVLTAAHVVVGAAGVAIRGPDKRSRLAVHDPAWTGDPDRLDLALLTIPDLPESLPDVPVAVVDRDASGDAFVEKCWSVGYPAFGVVERDGRQRIRDTAQVHGHIPPLSGLVEGLLYLQVTAAPQQLPGSGTLGKSQWAGMSGAAVFAGDALVGVVSEHGPQRGPSDITVTPLQLLSETGHAPANASLWWERLGVSDPSTLSRLPVAAGPPEPRYRATLRGIRGRAGVLLGRDDELQCIAGFAVGANDAFGQGTVANGYLWLVSGAWAGKTALLAEAVASMPSEVDVVAYFLVAREGAASREKFLGVLVPQLAWLLGIDAPGVVDEDVFRDLWERAALQARDRLRHLLLIVDGLDEDASPGWLSVAALLPSEQLGRHARVVVSSRPSYEVPTDVDAHHPLRTTAAHVITSSPAAGELKLRAEQEIQHLLRGESPEAEEFELRFHVLGLLTAAAGALSVQDLATMTKRKAPTIHAFISGQAARTLEPVGLQEARRYRFAHQTLLEACQQNPLVGGDRQYRDELYAWAEEWRLKGWPTADAGEFGVPTYLLDSASVTPLYLLDAYPATLAGDPLRPGDLQRLADLVSDSGWTESSVAQLGVDPVLASLRTAAQLMPAQPSVATMLRLLERQAHHLRHPRAVGRPGFVTTQMALEALRQEVDGVFHAAVERLRRLPVPQLIPIGTSERAEAHLVSLLGRVNGDVRAVAVTGAGLVVSGGRDGTLRMWNPATPGDPGRELGRDEGEVWSVAVTADGLVVSGGGNGSVRLWDPGTPGNPARELGRHKGVVRALAVTADGLVVSCGDDGAVRLWDPTTRGDPGFELGHHKWVSAVAATADGLVVSGGRDGAVRLWDPTASGNPPRELGRHEGAVWSVAVTADGLVVSGGDNTVRLWDPATTESPAREMGRQDEEVWAVAVTADGLVVSGGIEGAVLVWDPATPDYPVRELGRHQDLVWALAVTADGLVVSGGGDGTVFLWNPTIPDDRASELARGQHLISAVAATPDGLTVLGWDGGPVLISNLRPDEPARVLGYHRGRVGAVAVTADGLVVSGGRDGTVRLWNPANPDDPGRELGRHDAKVLAVAVTHDGVVVSGWSDGTVQLSYVETRHDTASELGRGVDLAGTPSADKDTWALAAAVTGDGLVVFGCQDGTVRLWNLTMQGEPARELGRQKEWVLAVAVTADGLVVSSGADGAVRLWDPTTPGAHGRELGSHETWVRAVAVTADGPVVSGGDDGALLLWDPATPGAPSSELARYDGRILALTVTDDELLWVVTPRGNTRFGIKTATR